MARPDQSRLDHLLAVDRADRRGLRVQLEERIRDDVRAGRLRAGAALPSSRGLSGELGLSRGVVVEAYAQLVAEGYLVARPGAATRVADVAPQAAASTAAAPPAAPGPALRFDFRNDAADLAAFPRRPWLAALRRTLAALPDAGLHYGPAGGAVALREALAAYLGRARGVVAEPGRTIVTAGTLQSLGLVARVLAAQGVTRVAVEQPGFAAHHHVIERAGLATVGVGVDEDGLRVDELVRARVGAVLVTPAHQAPLGAVLSPERRAALVSWAQETQALVLEDDYDGEFRYDRTPLGAVQGLAPACTVYLGSASKTLAPGVRLGWVVAPEPLAGALAREKGWSDGGTSVLEQHALADLITRGELDRHVRRARADFRRRRDTLLDALAQELPQLSPLGVAAGLHIAAWLPDGVGVVALLERAWAAGIGLYAIEHEGRGLLVLGYANCPGPSIRAGVRALAQIGFGTSTKT